MNLGEISETSMVGPLGTLVALIKIKLGQGSSKLGIFFWETLYGSFSCHKFWPGKRDIIKALMKNLIDIFDRSQIIDTKIFLFL